MKRRVHHLAARAGIHPAIALDALRQAGFCLPDIDSQVAKRSVNRAESVLNSVRDHASPGSQPFKKPAELRTRDSLSTAADTLDRTAMRDLSDKVSRLTIEDVVAIRTQMSRSLIADQSAFGQTAPLWPDKLEMAVNRQFTSGGGIYKYQTVWQVGATLAYGLTLSHAFENGNKRTALVALLIFLNRNKVLLVEVSEDDLYNLMTSIATHQLPIETGSQRTADEEVASLAGWLKAHGRALELGDQSIEFRELKKLLISQGCEFDAPKGNFIKIRRGKRTFNTGYPRPSFEVSVQEIKRIRRGLHLDEIHGFDSQGFYNLEGAVESFVNTHRNLMRRLADL